MTELCVFVRVDVCVFVWLFTYAYVCMRFVCEHTASVCVCVWVCWGARVLRMCAKATADMPSSEGYTTETKEGI